MATLAKQLRDLYTSADEGRRGCARRLERWVHERFSWDAAIDQITACLEQLDAGRP